MTSRGRYSEAVVGVLFIILVLLWFFRSPGFIPGWGSYFGEDADGNKWVWRHPHDCMIVLAYSQTALNAHFNYINLFIQTLLQLHRWRCPCNPYTISDVLYTDVYPTSWRQSRRQGTSSAQLAKHPWEVSMEHYISDGWRFCPGRGLWGRCATLNSRSPGRLYLRMLCWCG